MKSRLRILASLLLLASLLGSSNLLPYSKEQSTLPMPASFTRGALHGLSAQAEPEQLAPGPPCLAPSSTDTSSAQVQPGSASSSIPGSMVPAVRRGGISPTSSVPSSEQIQLELVFNLRNPSQFSQCLDSIMEPQSSNYGHFLDATTLLPYLPTPGERTSVTSFFTNAGFTVTQGSSPLVLQLSGTIALTESTLGVVLNYYQLSGSTFYAVNTDPSLPSGYASLLTGILGLDNYSTPRPAESPCSSPYCPQGIQVGYSLTNLYSAGDNGAGQTVAIVDAPGDPHIQTSINTYTAQYSSLPSITLTVITPDGTPSSYDPGWASEAAIDVEAVHTVAPGASITLLYGSSPTDDLMNLVDYVATNHLAKIVSNSWTYACLTGSCSDTQLSPIIVSSVDTRLAVDVAQGVTILFASGDQGAKPDGANFGTEFPGSDPNVLAVGATNLVLTGCGTMICSGYGSEMGASISGGGYSGYFSEPSWQLSTIGSTASKCTTGHMNPTCRAVPDVSMLGLNPGFWVYSSYVNMCVNPTANRPGWFSCSGTSLATPLWAGLLAIVLQLKNGVALGNVDPLLYQTANGPSYASIFHDITSGNNGYLAGMGWDPVTGWGTPIANNFATLIAQYSTPFSISYGDFLVWRPSNGTWYDFNPRRGYATKVWGQAGDVPLIGDVDGDGKPDLIIYRPSQGMWYILLSSSSYTNYKAISWGGVSGDIPLVGDVDGDHKADLIIYRPSQGVWYILLSSTNYSGYKAISWGGTPGDVPLTGDVDGDHKADLIIYRPSQGVWYTLLSSTGYTGYRAIGWGGGPGDVPLVGDIDGDHRTDLVIWRPSQGVWYILTSSSSYTSYISKTWGVNGDIPLVADYDGDGKGDLAIWRPSQGIWYILTSSTSYTGYIAQGLGESGDTPIPVYSYY